MNDDINPNQPKSLNNSELILPERDRFELLSAYLDGEVSSSERQQVKEWLENEPQTQKLYQRLVLLREQFQCIYEPESISSSQDFSNQVFGKIAQRERKQKRIFIASATIAAGLVAAISSLFTNGYSSGLKFAESPQQSTNTDLLMVAVNRPTVKIPTNMDFSVVNDMESLNK